MSNKCLTKVDVIVKFLFAATNVVIETDARCPGLKRPGREADHYPRFSAEVNNTCSCTSIDSYVSGCGAELSS
jgi:hypothetical protein